MTHHAPVTGSGAITDANVWLIVEQVWESLVQSPVEPAAASSLDAPDEAALSAVIGLSGAWSGAVELTCTERAATSIARVMLALPDDEDVTDVDVEDALGEVVNVIGGSVKVLVPGPSSLSLPSVTRDSADVVGPAVSTVHAGWRDGFVTVVVREHHDAQTTGAPVH